MRILSKSFSNINTLEKSMNACWLKNETISNNIANVNTPNFKRSVVKFESVLAQNLSNDYNGSELTHEKHIPVGSVNINDVNPIITKDTSSKYRKDGNNVNIDVEMADLSKNSMEYYMLKEMVAGNFRKLKLVIKDGR